MIMTKTERDMQLVDEYRTKIYAEKNRILKSFEKTETRGSLYDYTLVCDIAEVFESEKTMSIVLNCFWRKAGVQYDKMEELGLRRILINK